MRRKIAKSYGKLTTGSPKVKKMYEASETQKKLAQFIEENLRQFIYKPHKR